MGGENTEIKQELSDRQIIDKLKNILKCLETDIDVAQRKQVIDEGNELYKSRKDQLKSPAEKKQDEIKKILAERIKESEKQDKKGPPETVIKNIYPANETQNNKTITNNVTENVKECTKPPKVKSKSPNDDSEQPLRINLKNMRDGLLQGPNVRPFAIEFKMGEIIVGCQCIKRNGLQGDCKKQNCGGRKACLTLPLPTCLPAGYGSTKPKTKKVFIRKFNSSDESYTNKNSTPTPPVKKVETPKKLILPPLDYIDCPPVKPKVECEKHIKGRYYLRPLRKDETTQTETNENCQLLNNQNIEIVPVNNQNIKQCAKVTQPNTTQLKKEFKIDEFCPLKPVKRKDKK